MGYFPNLAAYEICSTLPLEWISEVATRHPGWVEKQIDLVSALEIDARLSKRYVTPFEAPYPLAIQSWAARILDARVLMRRGIDPVDDQYVAMLADATAAKAEVLEAANAETGLYDLPLRADTDASGLTRPAPRSYSEASPYVWTTRQAVRGRTEDGNGEGTSR
jgi:hypothetical protein